MQNTPWIEEKTGLLPVRVSAHRARRVFWRPATAVCL